jgi:hypothetical protein
MNNQPILFYSTRCSHSKQILDTLKALNKESLCRMASIDGKTRAQLPDFLKSVPTLYLPETKDVYIGKDIYAYIAKPVSSRREVPVAAAPPPASSAAPAKQVGGVPATPSGGADFQAWSFGTSTGFSDTYSSWDSPGNFSAADQLHYTFIGDTKATPPPNPEPQTKQSYEGGKEGRNSDVENRMKALQAQRDAEFQGVARK